MRADLTQKIEHKIIFVAPEFAELSKRLVSALHVHTHSSVESFLYRETDYERRVGRLFGRLLHGIIQIATFPKPVCARLELIAGYLRFDRRKFEQDLDVFLVGRTCQHIIFVKPMLFRKTTYERTIEKVESRKSTIILWDALWRTPWIEALIPLAYQVFSTEIVTEHPALSSLPIPFPDAPCLSSSSGNHKERRGRPVFFFCGAWSADRVVNAVRVRRALRTIDAVFICHLVTDRRILRCLSKLLNMKSTSLSAEEHGVLVGASDVLVDLGRVQQTSPSDRLIVAQRAGLCLLTTNSAMRTLGGPIVLFGNEPIRSVRDALTVSALGRDDVRNRWRIASGANDIVLSERDWVQRICFDRSGVNPTSDPTDCVAGGHP